MDELIQFSVATSIAPSIRSFDFFFFVLSPNKTCTIGGFNSRTVQKARDPRGITTEGKEKEKENPW